MSAAAPEAINTIVPGSGTGGGGGGLCWQSFEVSLVFGGHPPPVGVVSGPVPPPIGGGMETPGGGPPENALPGKDPSGIPGSSGISSVLRLFGNNRSAPLATASGRSSSAMVGSLGEVFAGGRTETWFPHRVRAVMWPSVSNFSPTCSFACLWLQ